MADENSQADIDSMFDTAPSEEKSQSDIDSMFDTAPSEDKSQADIDSMFDTAPSEDKSQADIDSMFDTAPSEPAPKAPPEDKPEAPPKDPPKDKAEDKAEDKAAEPDPEPETESADDNAGEDLDELDLEDIDFPDDDFDENFAEDSEGGGDKKKLILIGSAVFALLAALGGGAMFLFGSDEEAEVAQNKRPEAVLSLKIPGRSKLKMGQPGLKSVTGQAGHTTAPNSPAKNTTPGSNPNPGADNGKAPQTTPPEASRPRTQAGVGFVIPAVTAAAFKGIAMMQDPKPLPGPDRQLGESMGGGVIPKVSADGRQPWQIYAKPFSGEISLARVSIIIKGLGLSRAATIAAINHTPAEVTLAFDPNAKGVADWVGLARTAGHETLITLPMEPADFPTSDPGPLALQTDLQQTGNIDRLRYILSVSVGNVGLLQMMGSRFTTSLEALTPILQEIRARGLLMIDDGLVKNSQIVNIASTIALPRARSDVFIDQDPSRLGIMRGLSKLEAIAKKNSRAIGIARALPSSIANLMAWTKTLPGKKLILAPVSAVVKISGSGTAAKAENRPGHK